MKKVIYLLWVTVTILFFQQRISADTLYVGPDHKYKTPNDVAKITKDGDVILIASGTYKDQATQWYKNNITLIGTGKYARLIAPSQISNGKAIWVLKGNNITVENIEFMKATVPDKNGAGIRAEGKNLSIKKCYFHDNQNGILGGFGTVKIENTIFENNGFGDGYSHNVYIGHCDTLIFRFCYSHHAKIGHNLKSRARVNIISYNRIMDEKDGTSSYCIDLPNGGLSIILGNALQQGKYCTNPTLLALGAEDVNNPGHHYIVNNTIVNERSRGVFIKNFGPETVTLINNLFIGEGITQAGKSSGQSNIEGTESDIVDLNKFNYNLSKVSKAINAGTDQLQVKYNGDVISLTPIYEYVHPASFRKKTIKESIDAGAYEFSILSIKKKLNKSIIHHLNRFSIINDPTLKMYNMKGTIIGQYPLTNLKVSAGVYLCKTYDNYYTYKMSLFTYK